ncbi:MAG: hypothetical protein V1823_03435 [Chloroflexota bacterium]
MPSKSQHGRNKRTVRNKPRVVPATAVSPGPKPAVSPAPVVTGAASPRTAVVAAAAPAGYPSLMADLKRVGLLAGIILVVMLVLYKVMS